MIAVEKRKVSYINEMIESGKAAELAFMAAVAQTASAVGADRSGRAGVRHRAQYLRAVPPRPAQE